MSIAGLPAGVPDRSPMARATNNPAPTEAKKHRRASRSKALPRVPEGALVPYANSRPELKGLCLGDKLRTVLDSNAWAEVMVPILDEVERELPTKGPSRAYTSHELEAAVLFQRLAGCQTYGEARQLLASDREAATRAALGFDQPRRRYGKARRIHRSLDGVPSETTVWKHLKRVGLERHANAYAQLFAALVRDHFHEFSEMAEEARVINVDGSAIRSHYCSFDRVDEQTGQITKHKTMTGGGYRPHLKNNHEKAGHGYALVAAVTATGLPLSARITAINESESAAALEMMREDWRQQVEPNLGPRRVGVFSGDSAYNKPALRRELRQLGFIENTHPVSHARTERSRENAARHDRMTWLIDGYPNWRSNGHRELSCVCGEFVLSKRIKLDDAGRTIVRTEGDCPNCGPISITSGQWRLIRHHRGRGQTAFKRIRPGEEDRIDWRFGNPLTYHDELSEGYGRGRFGHGEGFHGHLVSRFKLLKDKAWYRHREQVERDALMIFCCMHALAMEQRRRAAGATPARAPAATGPPGLAAAA